MSPGPMTTAHRGGSLYQTRVSTPGRVTMLAASAAIARPAMPAAHHWRADHALRQADRIAHLARENVSPDMEPIDPDVNDDVPWQDMEPMDPTVDDEDEGYDEEPIDDMGDPTALALDASVQKVIVSGTEDEVTITAEPGETIVAVIEDGDDIHIEIEDTADVLLAYPENDTIIAE